MGRGKVQLKRIENKISRQVTFSKRRMGIMKKANEISVLCEAEVATIIFSSKGKLFDHSTDTSMEGILHKYGRHCYPDRAESSSVEPERNWAKVVEKLTLKMENLEINIRNFNGDDLEPLNYKKLQQLEHQMDVSLKRLRLKKYQMMLEMISELEKKDKILHEENKLIEKKISSMYLACGTDPSSTTNVRRNYEERGNHDREIEINATIPFSMLPERQG